MHALTLWIPWPDAALSPNSRTHHMALHRARKKAKNEAWGLTKALMPSQGIRFGAWVGPVGVHVIWHPSSARAFDLDNALARLKGHLDGIASALGVDDSTFTFRLERGAAKRPPVVEITLTPAAVALPVKGHIG